MEILLNAAFPMMAHPFPKFSTPKWKPIKPRLLHCSGKNGESIGLSRGPNQIELESEDSISELQSMNPQPEKTHIDIWRLFKEAQQNILYLNKQRLKALEELDKMKREKVNKQASTGKDKLSIRSELLLRIDSMVLIGMIDTQEASDLRKLIIDSKGSLVDDFSEILHQGDAELLAVFRGFSGKRKMKGFHIVHICTEMAPVTSVGYLASYITGLSCALQRKENFVEVILPKYSSLNLDEVKGLREIEAEFYSYFNGQLHANVIWTGVVCGIGVTFIQPVYYSSFFCREMMYGYSDDFERFAYFSRASLDYIVKSGKQPDVLHIHNWETSIVGPLFWDVFVNQGLSATRILLTCQAFNSQRLEHPDKLALCGLDPSRLHRPDRLQDHNKVHLINILKGGVVYSNKVVIMSSMHSKGHIIRNLSHGLEPTLAINKDKLMIAPFGFDNSTWDPSKDKLLPQSYSTDDMRGKDVCKVALQQHLGLRDHTSIVLVGCIFSEVSDVDVDNLKKLIWIASRRGAQFIIMGINKIPGINRALESFQGELKDENLRFLNEYDEALSHLVFAGSDIILCPSFDDPVSQAPLKAIRYGAAPIAMNFTDHTFRQFMDHDFESTKFSQYISNTFANVSLSQQIDEIKNNPSEWKRKIIGFMAKDLSWDAECCDIHLSAYTSITNL